MLIKNELSTTITSHGVSPVIYFFSIPYLVRRLLIKRTGFPALIFESPRILQHYSQRQHLLPHQFVFHDKVF
ncbi:unnamed protein product [Brugia timori]|uniref:Uncharacterized protein n=1 Tax=Brugia timori TaxID=42155 RepID=A0A0R3QH88_9BILA|nr:unnamed protein product [Brugia timori]